MLKAFCSITIFKDKYFESIILHIRNLLHFVCVSQCEFFFWKKEKKKKPINELILDFVVRMEMQS